MEINKQKTDVLSDAIAPEDQTRQLNINRNIARNTFGGLAVLASIGALALPSSSKGFSPETPVNEVDTPDVGLAGQASQSSEANYDFRKLSTKNGGAWSFFSDPRSIRLKKDIYTGWIGNKGMVQVSQYDTQSHKNKVVTLGPHLDRLDDHNNPSLFARKDGRIMAFYSPHSGRSIPKHSVSRMYYRTTKKPYDISKWGPVHKMPTNTGGNRLGYTYTNPISVGKHGTWVGWRGGNWQPTSAISPDHGKSWTKAKSFLKSTGKKRPYVKCSEGPNDSVIMTYNEDNPGTTGTGIFYLQYRPGKGYFKANGKKVAGPNSTIPVGKGDMIMSKHRKGRLYTMDVAADKDGIPATVYTAKPRNGGASVYYSKWTGGKKGHWHTERITGEDYNLFSQQNRPKNYGYYPTAGMSLDHNDPTTVYLSKQVDKKMRVQKWQYESKGNWTHENVSPKNKDCVRPASVRNDLGGYVVMMCGKYRDWLKFNTSIYIAKPKNNK